MVMIAALFLGADYQVWMGADHPCGEKMRICMRMPIRVYINMYIHMCMYIHVYTYTRIYLYTYVYIYVCVRMPQRKF